MDWHLAERKGHMYRTVLLLTLGILLGVCILGSLLLSWIRKKDFADQVSGKKPERRADPKTKISYDRPQSPSSGSSPFSFATSAINRTVFSL